MRRTVIPFLSTCAVRVAPIAQGILQALVLAAQARARFDRPDRRRGGKPARKAAKAGMPLVQASSGRRDQAVSAEIARAFRWKAP